MMGSRHAYLQFRSHINFISRISHTEEKGEVALAAPRIQGVFVRNENAVS